MNPYRLPPLFYHGTFCICGHGAHAEHQFSGRRECKICDCKMCIVFPFKPGELVGVKK